MGNCFSSSEPSDPPTRFRFTLRRKPRPDVDELSRSVYCSQCQRVCGHTQGRFYLKCLQCSNDYIICDRCFVKEYYHPVHAYAFVDNEERHRFMQHIAKRMEGWPILSPLLSDEQHSTKETLKCFNLLTDDNWQPKPCPNPVYWLCLQCPITFSLCHNCMAVPSQHRRHVFAMAGSDNLHNFLLAQLHSGALPLSLNSTDE